jgi:uncharacterized protein (TIRG00374 family)
MPGRYGRTVRSVRRILQITAVTLLTAIFLGLFLWKANLRDVWNIMRAANAGWIIVGLVVNFSALVFRAIRWRILIDARNPPPFYPTFFANTVGYMLSTVLPIRAGDIARPALLARRTTVRFADALGPVLTERVLDLITILSLFIVFCAYRWNQFDNAVVHGGAITASVVLVALILFVVGIVLFTDRVRRAHRWLGRIVPLRFRDGWMRFFDSFARSLEIRQRPAALGVVVFSTAAIWLCLVSQFWFVMIAMRRVLPFDSTFFLCAVTSVAVAIPTPGGVGGFHKICQWVLTTFYGYDIDTSVAAAVLFHVVGMTPVVFAGVVLFLREGLNWRQLSEETRAEET